MQLRQVSSLSFIDTLQVRWSEIPPFFRRSFDGKQPIPDDTVFEDIELTLSHVRAGTGSSRTLYVEGLKTLLAGREFWFYVNDPQSMGHPDKAFLGGVVYFDSYGHDTLQAKMVAGGYAVVEERAVTKFAETYRDEFRDSLLRIEGVARENQVGVWKPATK